MSRKALSASHCHVPKAYSAHHKCIDYYFKYIPSQNVALASSQGQVFVLYRVCFIQSLFYTQCLLYTEFILYRVCFIHSVCFIQSLFYTECFVLYRVFVFVLYRVFLVFYTECFLFFIQHLYFIQSVCFIQSVYSSLVFLVKNCFCCS